MIEQLLERRVMDAVEAIGIEGLAVSGAWQTAAEGELKGEENPDSTSCFSVAVGQRRFETFGFCKAEFSVSMAFVVMVASDPRGELIADVYRRVADLLTGWHLDEDGALSAALSVPGFHADGLRLDGGEPPQTMGNENSLRTVTFNFTIAGTIEH